MTKKIGDIMVKRLETIERTVSVGDAFDLMKSKSIRHVPVVDRATGKLLGLFSDRDAKRFISPFVGSPRETPQDRVTLSILVGKVMTAPAVVATPDEDVKAVVERMLIKKVNAVPVVDADKKLVGIVTTVDLMRLLIGLL